MPRKEPIEIQEPPINELQKRHACLGRSCLGGAFFSLVAVALGVGIYVYAKLPRVREISSLPKVVADSIPLYEANEIETITYLSGEDRSKNPILSRFRPEQIRSPLIDLEQEIGPPDSADQGSETPTTETGPILDQYLGIIRQPSNLTNDLFDLYWSNLYAEPAFILEFYEKELTKKGFTVILVLGHDDFIQELRFKDPKRNIHGYVEIERDDQSKRGTDRLHLHISLPPID